MIYIICFNENCENEKINFEKNLDDKLFAFFNSIELQKNELIETFKIKKDFNFYVEKTDVFQSKYNKKKKDQKNLSNKIDKLKNLNNELIKKNNNLNIKYDELNLKFNKNQDKINFLEKKYENKMIVSEKNIKIELSELKEQKNDLVIKYDEIKDKNLEMKVNYKKLLKDNENYIKELKKFKDIKKNLESNLFENKDKIKKTLKLQNSIDINEKFIDNLNDEIKNKNKWIEEYSYEINFLKLENKNLIEKIEILENKNDNNLKTEGNESTFDYNFEHESYLDELNLLNYNEMNAENDNNKLNKIISDFENFKKYSDEQREFYTKKIDELLKNNNFIHTKLNKVKNKKKDLKKLLEIKEKDIEALNKKRRKANNNNSIDTNQFLLKCEKENKNLKIEIKKMTEEKLAEKKKNLDNLSLLYSINFYNL